MNMLLIEDYKCPENGKWINFEEYMKLCSETGKIIKTEFCYLGGWPVYKDKNGKYFDLEY